MVLTPNCMKLTYIWYVCKGQARRYPCDPFPFIKNDVTAQGTIWKMGMVFFSLKRNVIYLRIIRYLAPFPTWQHDKVDPIGNLRLSRIKRYLYLWAASKFERATASERQSCRRSSQQFWRCHKGNKTLKKTHFGPFFFLGSSKYLQQRS